MIDPPPVLLVEDDENDAFFFERAFAAVGAGGPLVVVPNGDEAVRVLAEPGRAPPRLVVLDINLPGRSGLEVLRWIREQPAYDSVPVVIFSASTAERDVREAYRLRASSFVLKPSNLTELTRVVTSIVSYWLTINREERTS